jgi:serine protease Do
VVTAYSVVSNASRISVTLQDLSERPASLLSVDSTGVLATLLVEGPFPANAATLQASPEPAGGMALIAYWARNAGVASQMVQLPPTAITSGPFDIPFGLPIECNGAVLVDLAGKATAALVLSKGYREPPRPFPSSEGLFLFKVVPLALLEGTLSLVTSNGYQPWLGASVQPVDSVVARNLAIEAEGVYVAEVDEDSPAEKAGVRAGDIILEAEDQDIADISNLKTWLIQVQPGGSLKLKVRDSGGAHKQCVVTRPSS